MEKTGLQEAFTSLIYDGESSTTLMLQFKKKGNDAFADGKRNQASNLEYFRTAINHYYEALAWALKVEPMMAGDLAQADTDDPTYTEDEINVERAKICTNTATAHAQLKNWGYVRDESKKALEYDDKNVKAWFRLSQAYTELREWEAAGDSLDKGLAVDKESKDLLKLQKRVAKQVQAARKRRQQRERARAERVAAVKAAWKHCQQSSIRLGRVPLVTSVTDDEEEDDEQTESRWHQHLPHSGQLPRLSNGDWMWPCMLLYPSHNQSDFIKDFSETEMIAIRLAQVFPEFEEAGDETEMPWDKENEFTCSQLALYIEFHSVEDDGVVHPESVEQLRDQASAMRFYETSRALKGDEGEDMANVARAVARQHLHKQRKAWKKKHGSLWAKPDPNPVLRIHPAMSLKDVLKDARVMIPNVSVTSLTSQRFSNFCSSLSPLL